MFTYGYNKIEKGVKWLLIATISIYVVQMIPYIGNIVTLYGSLVPSLVLRQGQIWRLFTYAFLHDPNSFFHILFNMLILWMMGNELEQYWGSGRFLRFYCIATIGSGLFSLLNIFSPYSHIIGASGALFAIMTVYAFYFPTRTILLFFIIPMPVRTAVLILGIISLIFAFSSAGGFAHITHLGGIVVGLLYIKFYPSVYSKWFEFRRYWLERKRRIKQAKLWAQQNYFETIIDPLLKKISEKGWESLSAKEKKILQKASSKRNNGLAKNIVF